MPQSSDVLSELDAGIFMQKFEASLKEAGLAAIGCGKQAKVTIELKFDRIENSRQVKVTHKVANVIPRETGKNSDEDIKTTPIYVHSDGTLSIFSEDQLGFNFTKPNTKENA